MKHPIRAALLAGLVLVCGSAFAGEGGAWVSADGDVHKLHGSRAIFVGDGDAERFDLSDLRPGETRTFGSGDRAVTVSRDGDAITIRRADGDGDDVSVIDVTCSVERDTCAVLTFPDDPEKVMIAIEKERSCVDGEGDCDFAFGDMAAMEGHFVVDIDCEGDDCADVQALNLEELHKNITVEALDGGDGESRIVIRRVGTDGEHAEGNVFVTHSGSAVFDQMHSLHTNKVTLRCSEGDATVSVDKEEAEDTFLCPKHSTPMEQVKHRIHAPVRVIKRGTPHEH